MRRREEKREAEAALREAVDEGDKAAEERIRDLLETYADVHDDSDEESEQQARGSETVGEGVVTETPETKGGDDGGGGDGGGDGESGAGGAVAKGPSPHAVFTDDGVVVVIEPPTRVVHIGCQTSMTQIISVALFELS